MNPFFPGESTSELKFLKLEEKIRNLEDKNRSLEADCRIQKIGFEVWPIRKISATDCILGVKNEI